MSGAEEARAAQRKVNRIFLVVVSQDGAPPEPDDWNPLWDGHGGIKVFAIDRERCLVPVNPHDFRDLLEWKPYRKQAERAAEKGEALRFPDWDVTPPAGP